MSESYSRRAEGSREYARLIQLTSVRLRLAAARGSASRDAAVQALDAEADSIIEVLAPIGTDLQVGNALAGAGLANSNWSDIANDVRAVGDSLAHAAQDVGNAFDHALSAVGDAVGAAANSIVDAVTHIFGGVDITQQETVEVIGLIDQIAAGGSAEELAAAKQSLIELYATRTTELASGGG
jgi:hypothetical protein